MRTLFNLSLAALIGFSVSFSALAVSQQSGKQADIPSPIKDVAPYVEKDKSSVIVFFKFGCPACRMYHSSLASWGRSLPKGIDFQFYPVIEAGGGLDISIESMVGLQAFWVSERLGNSEKREVFADSAYSLSQDEGAGQNKDRWFDALASQYPKKAIVSAWKSELALGDARYQRQLHYMPTSTPTLVVCGKWMISPDATQGNQELFAQLANGLVSRCAGELNLKIKRK